MFIQENLIIGVNSEKKRKRKSSPNFKKVDKIRLFLEEWNTIKDVELYQELYEICCQLFLATQHNKLACLNYYIDHESESDTGEEHVVMYAEIKDTWQMEMIDRYNAHKELLERVMSNDTTLIYSENSETQTEEEGQLSLFG